jgi:hypothetical protein
MRSYRALTLMTLSLAISTALTGCGGTVRPASPTLNLSASDRTRTQAPDKPAIARPLAPTATPEAAAERSYLWKAVVEPLMAFSLAQEEATQAAAQRADGVVAKVDAHNAAIAPKGWKWPWAKTPP